MITQERSAGVSPPMVQIDGGKVRRLREAKGLTQLYVATAVGVTTDTISRWENRRYPFIRMENGLKLAEALEVPLEDIRETREEDLRFEEKGETGPEPVVAQGAAEKGQGPRRLVLVMAALVLAGALLAAAGWWWMRGGQEADLSAYRWLPRQTPPGQIFPVHITVEAGVEVPFSILLKEMLPPGCLPLEGEPRFTAVDQEKGLLKWIGKSEEPRRSFAYLARADPGLERGTRLRFEGTVTPGKAVGAFAAVGGQDVLEVADFHWADANRDGRIDDEEILGVYDLFEPLGLAFDWEQIEDIWSGRGYKWDAGEKGFVIIPFEIGAAP